MLRGRRRTRCLNTTKWNIYFRDSSNMWREPGSLSNTLYCVIFSDDLQSPAIADVLQQGLKLAAARSNGKVMSRELSHRPHRIPVTQGKGIVRIMASSCWWSSRFLPPGPAQSSVRSFTAFVDRQTITTQTGQRIISSFSESRNSDLRRGLADYWCLHHMSALGEDCELYHVQTNIHVLPVSFFGPEDPHWIQQPV
jgi:hypothetical protein